MSKKINFYDSIAIIYDLVYCYLLILNIYSEFAVVVENVYVGKRHKSVLHYQTGFHRI